MKMYFTLLEGNNVFVARCNQDDAAYRAYYYIAHNLGCGIQFFSAANMESPLYLAVALASAKKRDGGEIHLKGGGNGEEDQFAAIMRTFEWLRKKKGAQEIEVFRMDAELASEAEKLYAKAGTKEEQGLFYEFAGRKQDALVELLIPKGDVSKSYSNAIENGKGLVVREDEPQWVSGELDFCSRKELLAKVGEVEVDVFTMDHITIRFRDYTKKDEEIRGKQFTAVVKGLYSTTDMVCWKVEEVQVDGKEVDVSNGAPHITVGHKKGVDAKLCSEVLKGKDAEDVKQISVEVSGNVVFKYKEFISID